MGIDYYVFNLDKKEYVWLGRGNPVGELNKRITNEMLDATFQDEFYSYLWFAFDQFKDIKDLEYVFINDYRAVYKYHTELKKYIGKDNCVAVDDASDWDLFNRNFKNNELAEDLIAPFEQEWHMIERTFV